MSADPGEAVLRAEIVQWGQSLFARGLTAGSSGNISVRCGDGYLTTPTNACLGFLQPSDLSRLDAAGNHLDGALPTKELPLHMAFYRERPAARAVVHLHSTYATALSCLADTDPEDAIPPITPYVVMRVGRVPLLPYSRPGAQAGAEMIAKVAARHTAVLLQNHGPILAGSDLRSAIFAIEELEEAAKLIFLTQGRARRLLDTAAIDDLNQTFNLK